MKKNKLIPKCQIGTQLPIAPMAEERYKKSSKKSYIQPKWDKFSPTTITSIVETYNPLQNKGYIKRDINYSPNNNVIDTIYSEVPPSYLPVKRLTRAAGRYGTWNNNKFLGDSVEYKTLQRRFNTAWNLAK